MICFLKIEFGFLTPGGEAEKPLLAEMHTQ